MKNLSLLLVVVLALCVERAHGSIQIPTVFNTGVDASGTPLPDGTVGDPHYSLLSVPVGSTTDIRVRTSAGGFPIPPYIGDDPLSAWIGPNNDNSLDGPVGQYDYRTTFDLTGFNPLTADITGGWTSDNDGVQILINGVDSGNPPTSFTQFSTGFAPFTIAAGFVPGINTVDFVLNNGGSGGNPTALRVEMTGTADPAGGAVPESTSILVWGLLGLTVGGFAYVRSNV
jgi:hypothetical protein